MAAMSTLLLVTMLAVDPKLAEERVHPGMGTIDPGIRIAASCLFLLTLTTAAVDVGRLHTSHNMPAGLRFVALILFTLNGSLQAWAMAVNPFFSPVIRLQKERGHHVIDRGPYRYLRHPGYLAMLISLPATAIAIGSWLALIPAMGFAVVIVRRANMEDKFLKKNLFGYAAYASQVPVGLFLVGYESKSGRRRPPDARGRSGMETNYHATGQEQLTIISVLMLGFHVLPITNTRLVLYCNRIEAVEAAPREKPTSPNRLTAQGRCAGGARTQMGTETDGRRQRMGTIFNRPSMDETGRD